jgi:protein-disulfide isomerase
MAKQTRAQIQQSRRSARQQAAHRAQTRRKQLQFLASAVVAAIVIVVILVVVNRPTGTKTTSVDYTSIPTDGQTLGDPNAPVTVTEYADYQCPYCKQFATEQEAKLVNDYVKTGKVKLVFHDFPFLGGQNNDNDSFRAAEASRCATDQGKFWQYHDALFDHQGQENSGAFSQDKLVGIAKDVGLNTTTFTQCMDSNKYEQAVAQSRDEASKAGVSSTPSFGINGAPSAYQSYDVLTKQIDIALQQKGK